MTSGFVAPLVPLAGRLGWCSQARAARRRGRAGAARGVLRAQLVGMPAGFGGERSAFEVLLGELMFSSPDALPGLVEGRMGEMDGFCEFVEGKLAACSDLEERENLRLFLGAVREIVAAVETNAGGAAEVPDAGDVAAASYDELIGVLVNASQTGGADALRVAVDAAYDRVDMRLLERLQALADAGGDGAEACAEVQSAISRAMSVRVERAVESMQRVLRAAEPVKMRAEIDALARVGGVDDAFVLLLQGNLEQAKAAGPAAEQAVAVLSMLLKHASDVKDVNLDPEIRLVRALLRTDDSETRIVMLKEALQPRKSVTLVDGSESSGVRVDGKKLVSALRKLIEEFGNIDEAFVLKVSAIGEESEAVARQIYDMEDKDVKDLQEEAFHKRSVSIWDLERIEIEEKVQGRKAAWEGQLGAIPESLGFNAEGKKII